MAVPRRNGLPQRRVMPPRWRAAVGDRRES
jgi:hypothetical protein